MYLHHEVAGDMIQERLRIDKDVPQGERIDPERQVTDVHKVDAQCRSKTQLAQSSCLISRSHLGYQCQIAHDALHPGDSMSSGISSQALYEDIAKAGISDGHGVMQVCERGRLAKGAIYLCGRGKHEEGLTLTSSC